MKVIRRLLLVLVLLALIGGVVLFTLPAQVAYRWGADRLGPLRLDGIAGTVWDGRANSVSAFNQALGSLEWRVAKMPLLSRRVVSELILSGGAVQAKGHAVREPNGELRAVAVD